jgi:hypothetical protein
VFKFDSASGKLTVATFGEDDFVSSFAAAMNELLEQSIFTDAHISVSSVRSGSVIVEASVALPDELSMQDVVCGTQASVFTGVLQEQLMERDASLYSQMNVTIIEQTACSECSCPLPHEFIRAEESCDDTATLMFSKCIKSPECASSSCSTPTCSSGYELLTISETEKLCAKDPSPSCPVGRIPEFNSEIWMCVVQCASSDFKAINGVCYEKVGDSSAASASTTAIAAGVAVAAGVVCIVLVVVFIIMRQRRAREREPLRTGVSSENIRLSDLAMTPGELGRIGPYVARSGQYSVSLSLVVEIITIILVEHVNPRFCAREGAGRQYR